MQIISCSSFFDSNHRYMIIANNYTCKQQHKHINNSTIRKCWIWGFVKIAYDRACLCLSQLWNNSVWPLQHNLDFPVHVLRYNLITVGSHGYLSTGTYYWPFDTVFIHDDCVWVKLWHHKNPTLGTLPDTNFSASLLSEEGIMQVTAKQHQEEHDPEQHS